MELEQKYAEVFNIRLFYREGGNQFAKQGTRLFLHGWGLTSFAFENTLKALSQHYHVIGVDLPGFGKSASLKRFGYEVYAEVIHGLLCLLDIKKAHLMGQSMGGGICMALGALFPDRVQSMVLFNSAGIPMQKKPSFLIRTSEIVEQLSLSRFRKENFKVLSQFFYNLILNSPTLSKSIQVPIEHDLRPLLHKIKAPCLLAWGTKDDMLPVALGQEMSSYLVNARMVLLEDGHHEWCAVYPERLVGLVQQFYDELKL